LTESYTDLSIPGRGIPLAYTRVYDSLAAGVDAPLGFGWTTNYSMSLSQPQVGAVVIQEEGGSQITFTLSGSTYTAPPRVVATLVANGDGTFTFTRRGHERFTFSAAGRLTRAADLNGYVTALTYNGQGQLTTVADPAGRSFTLVYTGSHVTTLSDSTGRNVLFGYNDAYGNLTDA
jgi:YD repeat-containing protein